MVPEKRRVKGLCAWLKRMNPRAKRPSRIDCIVRSMVIEEVADKRSSYDDDDGKTTKKRLVQEARPIDLVYIGMKVRTPP